MSIVASDHRPGNPGGFSYPERRTGLRNLSSPLGCGPVRWWTVWAVHGRLDGGGSWRCSTGDRRDVQFGGSDRGES